VRLLMRWAGPTGTMCLVESEVKNMIGEICVTPQTDGSARELIPELLAEIAGVGLRYDVGALGTSVEGDLDAILDAVRSIERRLEIENVQRALIELRLQIEPHPETLEHQVAGMVARGAEANRRKVTPLRPGEP